MQDYNLLKASDLLSASRGTINNNLESIKSNFSGTYFPTQNLAEGMFCWRTDLKKMYQLQNDLVTWNLVYDMSEGQFRAQNANNSVYATKDNEGNNIAQTYFRKDTLAILKDELYPVGSVIMTMTPDNPSGWLGGEWQQIAGGRTLIGASSAYKAGNTGGSETKSITLTKDNIPAHNHTMTHRLTATSAGAHTHTRGTMNITGSLLVRNNRNSGYASGPGPTGAFTEGSTKYRSEGNRDDNMSDKVYNFDASRSWSGSTSSNGAHTHSVTGSVTSANTGSGTAFSVNAMQPYLVTYIWQKVRKAFNDEASK